jgi:polyisoprenoid-binding protein YceI
MSTTLEQLQLPSATWSLDPVHSSAAFAVNYMVSTFRTTFDRFDATLDTTGGEPTLTGTVDPASIVIKDENFKGHLMSPDFFDVQNHPEITFESTSFRRERSGDEASGRGSGDQLVVEGDLTIKGRTQRVVGRGALTEPYQDLHGNDRVGVQLEAVVDRDAFGVSWNAPLPSGGLALAKDVRLVVELFLVKA